MGLRGPGCGHCRWRNASGGGARDEGRLLKRGQRGAGDETRYRREHSTREQGASASPTKGLAWLPDGIESNVIMREAHPPGGSKARLPDMTADARGLRGTRHTHALPRAGCD